MRSKRGSECVFAPVFCQILLAGPVIPSMIEDNNDSVVPTDTQLSMVDDSKSHDLAIQWFREASPYIKAYRGATVVLCLPGDLIESDLFNTLIPDLTLLSHLGVQLVVGFGLRAQIDAYLNNEQETSTVIDGRRVTNDAALNAILTAAGKARAKFESRLSMGLPNTPMAGARLSVCSGNFVSAQPYGVHNGVDYEHTGTVRQVHSNELRTHLASGNIVLLPPTGYSLTGDSFNLPSEEVCAETAIALNADKLIFFVEKLPVDSDGAVVREASANTMERLASQQNNEALMRTIQRAIKACRKGVARVHLLSLSDSNALLRELFTRDGGGTLVTAERWENLRAATVQDVNGIINLIEPQQEKGSLALRTREQLEIDIDHFVVCEREGMVIACAALFAEPESNPDRLAEIACVVTHPDYRGQGRAADLVAHLENKARSLHMKTVMLLSTNAAHWFIERGYIEQAPEDMPTPRKIAYDNKRNSKVFVKQL